MEYIFYFVEKKYIERLKKNKKYVPLIEKKIKNDS